MAATTGLTPAILGPLAPQPASAAAAPAAISSTVKTMKQLMDEIDQAKIDVETVTKPLEKLDTGRKKAAAHRDEAVKGRIKIRELTEHVVNLEKQMNAMTKTTDPTYDAKLFDKTKKNALKSLSNLSNKLDHADKHLEKITGTTPVTVIPSPDSQTTTKPADTVTASTEGEHSKGVSSLLRKLPFNRKKTASKESLVATPQTVPIPSKPADETGDAAQKTPKKKVVNDDDEEEEEEDEEEEEEGSDDDDDVISDKKKGPEKSPRLTSKALPSVTDRKKPEVTNVESDETGDSDEEDDDDDEGAEDNRKLLDELKSRTLTDEVNQDSASGGRRSQLSTTPRSSTKVPLTKTDSIPSTSPRRKKTPITSPPLPPARIKTASPRRHREVPTTKKKDEESEDESYFEEEQDEEEDDEELRGLRDTGDHEEVESDHDYDEQEEEPTIVNAHVQELRTKKYSPGTQFIVTHGLDGVQTGDLTIHKGEILTLVEQRPDDWWLFQNTQNQQQGVVPINHIQLLSGERPRRRVKPSTSATTLVDAFKANNNIPAGFISSDLAPLTQIEDYQLWRALVPKMTDSNLAFVDLQWRADTDKIHVHDVTYQKILTIKECVKIPRVKGEQIRVLDRCVRICLYDGLEIVSNIHTIRALTPRKIDERDLSEDWYFVRNEINTLTDEQPQLLIRSNRSNQGQNLNLLIELSLWCQSTVTQEKCEIACGWSMIPLQDDKPPLITDTKSYNELLHGGHIDETNVLLDPQYKILRSDGLSGMIDRFKRARIKFSIESRETDIDLLYDNLPIQSLIVPINLIKTLAFFRNELAFQIHKRQHPTGLSTTPIDSIFLSTFFQTLEQPDLIYTLRRVYRTRRKRYLNSSSSSQQQREEFIITYERFIYPLLHYRQLPSYDFHDISSLNERRKLINDMVKRQLPAKKTAQQDILSILLDPNLTDKWTPFTSNEICFTLQKYIHDFTSDIVA